MKLLIAFLLIASIATAQEKKDSTRPDSVYVRPDTVVLKVPSRLFSVFAAIMLDQDRSYFEMKELQNLFDDQIRKQEMKKPKK